MNAAEIRVLKRAEGYLRLRLPLALRAAGASLEAGLRTFPGVERVTLLSSEGRLAVRFDPRTTTHAAIAQRIKDILSGLAPSQPTREGPAASAQASVQGEAGLAERLDDLRERLIAAAPQRLRPLVESATTEKAITNFLNDVLAFYLIKVHWDLIVNRWLKDPLKYGNAWLTVFYLVFLLMRYRKS